MGDRAPVHITIGGTLPHEHLEAFAAHAADYDLRTEWDGEPFDPAALVAGWRALTGRLRPGGFMRIGLYSELARASVVAARELIAREGFPDDADGIRAARHALMRTLGDEHAQLFRWRDFYSLQEVRDLVFHVQEHRFTIPQIQDALRTLGLEFVGFDLRGPALLNGFRERFPEPGAESDLAAWAVYEAENPGAFAAMYQFWVRKA